MVEVSDKTSIAMPIRNLIGVVSVVVVGVWAYFGIMERLNNIETNLKLIDGDIVKNTDFRIRWPLGELGALPDDAKQFMLIEHLSGVMEDVEDQVQTMMHNKVNIDRLQRDVDKALEDIEKLKDKIRDGTHGPITE